MPLERILIIIGLIAVIALFGFQLWRVLRTGHVRWRVQKVHRANRPVASDRRPCRRIFPAALS
jgi:FtsZ-interacting cell division protein ZipA